MRSEDAESLYSDNFGDEYGTGSRRAKTRIFGAVESDNSATSWRIYQILPIIRDTKAVFTRL